MQDEVTSSQPDNNGKGHIPAAWVRFIQQLQHKSEEEAPTSQNEKRANDDALVRHARNTAWATIIIAGASVLTFGAALLQYFVFSAQLGEMKSTGKQTDDLIASNNKTAAATLAAANAAVAANATTRAQINASLIIPDDPESKIRIGPDGTITVDLYVANIGQSWARDVYVNIDVTVRNGGRQIYHGPPAFGGEFDISPQTPWHHAIDDFSPKFPTSVINSGDELDVAVTIAVSYSNIFDERNSRIFQLHAWRGDINSVCCTLKELADSVELERHADLSRLPAIPAK
jgi:hypothetical protein